MKEKPKTVSELFGLNDEVADRVMDLVDEFFENETGLEEVDSILRRENMDAVASSLFCFMLGRGFGEMEALRDLAAEDSAIIPASKELIDLCMKSNAQVMNDIRSSSKKAGSLNSIAMRYRLYQIYTTAARLEYVIKEEKQ